MKNKTNTIKNKIRKFLQKNKNKYLLFFSLAFSGIFLVARYSRALFGSTEEFFSQAIAFIVQIQFYISAVMLELSGAVLDMVLGSALEVQNLRAVELGWSLARDTVNMFFVIFLLIIAFATILRIESYHYKQLLPKLVISVLLVNFSRTICSALIEFSNVLTSAFLNFGGGASSAEAIAALMGLQDIYQLDESFDLERITDFSMLISFMLAAMIVTAMAWIFAGLAGMLLLRTVVLLVLIVISPLAFGMNILPLTQSYFKRWWDEFIKYLFYAPIAAFCLYLAAVVVSEAKGVGSGGYGLGRVINSGGNSGGNTENILPGAFTNADFMWEFGLAMGLLGLSILMIKEGGGMGAQIAMNGAKKGAFGAYGLAGKGLKRAAKFGRYKAGGEGWKRAADKQWQKKNYIRGGLMKAMNLGAKATRLPAAWKAQAEKDYARSDAKQVGWARDRINALADKPFLRSFMKGDRVGYESQNFMAQVDEERGNLKNENPNKEPGFLMQELKKATNTPGEEARAMACMQDLVGNRNRNEIASLEAKDEEFAKIMLGAENMELRGHDGPEAMHKRLTRMFGEEEGGWQMMKLCEQAKGAGDWSWAQYMKVDPATGKAVVNDKAIEEYAGEFQKRDADTRARTFRGGFARGTKYNPETGEEEVDGAHLGYAKYIRDVGWGGQDASRLERNMGADAKAKLMHPKVFNDIAIEIENQLNESSGAKGADGEIHDYSGRRELAINNLKAYEKVASSIGWNVNKDVEKRLKSLLSKGGVNPSDSKKEKSKSGKGGAQSARDRILGVENAPVND